jgi:hypothetical protein
MQRHLGAKVSQLDGLGNGSREGEFQVERKQFQAQRKLTTASRNSPGCWGPRAPRRRHLNSREFFVSDSH